MTINSYYWDLFSLLATALVTSASVTGAAAVYRQYYYNYLSVASTRYWSKDVHDIKSAVVDDEF